MVYKLSGNVVLSEDRGYFSNVNMTPGTVITVLGVPPNISGTHSGFSVGGVLTTAPSVHLSMDRFPFASGSETAASAGTLSYNLAEGASSTSDVSGYMAGGLSNPIGTDYIIKYPLSTWASTFTDVGNLTASTSKGSGASSDTHGFSVGGQVPAGASTRTTNVNRFPFSTDTDATNVGTLTTATAESTGFSSLTFGYSATGNISSTTTSRVTKFPFASTTNVTMANYDVMTPGSYWNVAGSQSMQAGYVSGGLSGIISGGNEIRKYLFANDTVNISRYLDNNVVRNAGISSTENSYTVGGYRFVLPGPGYTFYTAINKFPFSVDSAAVASVGNLSVARNSSFVHQD